MTTWVEDNFDSILEHLSEMSKVAGRLRKLCKYGKISVDNLEVASLTASLPSTYSTVTSSFKRQDSVNAKAVAAAVREEIVTRRNRGDISIVSSSSANLARITGIKTRSPVPKVQKTKKVERTRCDYCKNYHKGRCHKKEMDELKKELETMRTNTAKSQMRQSVITRTQWLDQQQLLQQLNRFDGTAIPAHQALSPLRPFI